MPMQSGCVRRGAAFALRSSLGLFVASAMLVTPARAQRGRPGQVIVLEDVILEAAPWVADVVAVETGSCPGAAWLRACGAPAIAAECPSLRVAGEALGERGRAACLASAGTASASLLPIAEALFRAGERDRLEWAAALYGALARVDGLTAMASLRAARTAERLDRPSEVMAHVYELLRSRPPGPYRAAALRLGATIVSRASCDGHDELDHARRARCVSPEVLPDAPWAAQIALVAVDILVWSQRFAEARTVADAARARFGRSVAEPLERAELRAALLSLDFEDRVIAAERCHARGASCTQPLIDAVLRGVVAQLAHCRAEGDLDRAISYCSAGIAFGQRVSALRPIPALAQDMAAATTWLEASRERLHAQLTRRSRRRAERRAAEAVLARPAPPDVQVATPMPAEPPEPSPLDLGAVSPYDVALALERRSAPLSRCAGSRAEAISLTLRFDAEGVLLAAEPSTSTAAAQCVARALREPVLQMEVAGAASAPALVMLPPS